MYFKETKTMDTINNIRNNVNFTARMNILTNDVNLKRVRKISEIFEAQTKDFAQDTFELNGTKQHGYQIYHFDKDLDEENCCDMTTEQWNKLFRNSDEFISKKFIKLFEIFKNKDEEISKAKKYIEAVMKRDKNIDPTDFQQKFWDIFIDKVNKDRDIAVANDSILKNFEVY